MIDTCTGQHPTLALPLPSDAAPPSIHAPLHAAGESIKSEDSNKFNGEMKKGSVFNEFHFSGQDGCAIIQIEILATLAIWKSRIGLLFQAPRKEPPHHLLKSLGCTMDLRASVILPSNASYPPKSRTRFSTRASTRRKRREAVLGSQKDKARGRQCPSRQLCI